MNIFTIYIGIIKPLFCFDCTNFKVSVIIKIINFNEILKNGLFNYVYHLPCECDYLSNFQIITHLFNHCWKKSFFEMKNFKLVTWYPNMVQIMCNDMVQYTFNFNEKFKSFNLFLDYICVFEYTSELHLFSEIYSNLPLYKMKWNH